MQIVEAYLMQVATHLAARDREDIVAELRSEIEAQIEERAGAQSGASADAVASEVLGGLGHPLKVASSYSDRQYLIGPEWYPLFLHSLKIVLCIVLAIQIAFVLATTLVAAAPWQGSIAGLLVGLLTTALWVTVIVTGVFAALEYSGEQFGWYQRWQPAQLTGAGLAPISRSDLVTNIVSEAVFLLWWNNVLSVPGNLPAAIEPFRLVLSSVWEPLYWPLNILVGACIVLHLLVLMRGFWHTASLCSEIVVNLALILIALGLLLQGDALVASAHTESGGWLSHAQTTARITLAVVMGFALWDVWLAWRRLGSWRG